MEPAQSFSLSRGLKELCERARSQGLPAGATVSFSPKVFIPLTRLCRDRCGYCAFRQEPMAADRLYMTPEEVLRVARQGERAGCGEALFVLGERPEQRYREARKWLRERGLDSTVHYLREVCRLVLEETSLYPHSNAGVLSEAELAELKPVNASLGLMLESVSSRLCQPGGPHQNAPSKRPELRLRTLEAAGRLKIPFTTGLLVGIGETRQERLETLQSIAQLQQRHGHIQEVIVQNFRAKPATPMAQSPEASRPEMMETVALARLTLGGSMNIQVPPNLNGSYEDFLDAGLNDWGGVSPVTRDFVNPEAAWPSLEALRIATQGKGFQLKARFPVYPEYILGRTGFLPETLRGRLLEEGDGEGFLGRQERFGLSAAAFSSREARA